MTGNERQPSLWETPEHAKIGELLARFATWCDARPHITFSLQRSSVTRIRRSGGGSDPIRGWALDVRRRGAVVQTLTASSLGELARVGDQWLSEQVDRSKK